MARWLGVGDTLVHGLSVLDAGALLASAPRYVGNDSGVSHLAGAVARQGVVLFGPTRAARWRPRGGGLRALEFSDADPRTLARTILASLGIPGTAPAPHGGATSLDTPTPEH
jgi:hypothetical protein